MKKRLVCLSNSKKLGGRCLAGIELDDHNNPVFINGSPKWIRPVSEAVHGEVPTDWVHHLNILDIIEIEVTGTPNTDYQCENALFQKNSLRKIGTLERTGIISVCENPETIFDNNKNAVAETAISDLTRSLILIKTNRFKVIDTTYEDTNKRQIRLAFTHRGNRYDLPITDLVFLDKYKSEKGFLDNIQELILCLSLGVPYNGFHYKLIAGVIKWDNQNHSSKTCSHSGADETMSDRSPECPRTLDTPEEMTGKISSFESDTNHSNLTVTEAALKELGVSIEVMLARFKRPGWFFVGETIACCPICNRKLAGFRMPYNTSAGKQYYYWALVCPSCACSYEPKELGKDVHAALYKSSTFRPS